MLKLLLGFSLPPTIEVLLCAASEHGVLLDLTSHKIEFRTENSAEFVSRVALDT